MRAYSRCWFVCELVCFKYVCKFKSIVERMLICNSEWTWNASMEFLYWVSTISLIVVLNNSIVKSPWGMDVSDDLELLVYYITESSHIERTLDVTRFCMWWLCVRYTYFPFTICCALSFLHCILLIVCIFPLNTCFWFCWRNYTYVDIYLN